MSPGKNERLEHQSDADFINSRLDALARVESARHHISDGESASDVYAFYAAQVVEKSKDPKTVALFSVISRLGAIDAVFELDKLREKDEESSRKREKELKIEHIIPFNHALKEFINKFPDMHINEARDIFAEARTRFFDDKNPITGETRTDKEAVGLRSASEYPLFAALNGMRHELAAETILASAGKEYSYDVSVSDDSKGIDMYVEVDGRMERIDIKASEEALERNREKYPDSRAVWTGLAAHDFTGIRNTGHNKLSISFDGAQKFSEGFISRINETVRSARKAEEKRKRRIAKKVIKTTNK